MSTSKAQMKATVKYKEKAQKRIPLDVRIEEYEAIKKYTEKTGESINGFIRKIIKENIKQLLTYTYEYSIIKTVKEGKTLTGKEK